MKLEQWAAGGGAPLARELATGYRRLGLELYDSLFRLYPFPDRSFQGAGLLSAAFGLAPAYPATRGTASSEAALPRRIEWSMVDSLRPTLRWQAFPRELDRAAAPGDAARLPAPAHALETSLQPAAFYYWSVRARFELDGRERVTEWSTTNYAAFGRMSTPSRWSYRFRTP